MTRRSGGPVSTAIPNTSGVRAVTPESEQKISPDSVHHLAIKFIPEVIGLLSLFRLVEALVAPDWQCASFPYYLPLPPPSHQRLYSPQHKHYDKLIPHPPSADCMQ